MTPQELIEEIKKMTVLDLSKLVKALEEEFGVSAAMPMAMAAGPAAAAPVEEVEEQTEFDVILKAAGEKKINVIKVVRADHRPGPERSQGPGRRRPQPGQAGHPQGRGRGHQEAARRSRRRSRSEVVVSFSLRVERF